MIRLSRAVTRLSVMAGLMLAVATASPAAAQSAIRDTEIEGIIREWADPVFVGTLASVAGQCAYTRQHVVSNL